jgi:hypothetical protein
MATPEANFSIDRPARRRWPALALAASLLVLVALGVMYHFRANSVVSPELPAAQVSTSSSPIVQSEPKKPARPADQRTLLNAIREHLLLHLPLSSSLTDHSASAHKIELTGSVEVHDSAAHFPGDAYLTLPHIPLNDRPFAFALWIKPEGKIVGYGLLEQSGGGPGKMLHILLRDPDRPYFGFYMSDLRASQSIQPGVWTHLAFQFTGTHQQIWINGQLAVERVSDPYQGETGDTLIGKAPNWSNVSTRCYTGAMRDLRLYGVALTAEQIRVLAGLEASPTIKRPDIF